MPGSFQTTGFHDLFYDYSVNGHGPSGTSTAYAFQQAASCHGNTIRFAASWDVLEPTANGFSLGPYLALSQRALDNGLKLLPVLAGCPSWVPDRYTNNWGQSFYPGPGSVSQFGDFAVKLVQAFQLQGNAVAALEVWNEPNVGVPGGNWLWNPNTGGTWTDLYISMMQSVLDKTDAAFGRTNGIPNMWVLTGSFAYVPGWETFFSAVDSATSCVPRALSIHPYSGYAGNPDLSDSAGIAATKVMNAILGKFDDIVNNRSSRPIWVTETGCPSKAPFGEPGQRSAIQGISAGLAQRSHCAAMLLYRLFDWGNADSGNTYTTYPVLRKDTWERKEVCDALATAIWP